VYKRYFRDENGQNRFSGAAMCDAKKSVIEAQISSALTERYGYLVGGRDLRKVLGFATSTAFRQAKMKHRLPVRVFKIEGRGGVFATPDDLAAWLVQAQILEAGAVMRSVNTNARESN